jgi:hypothetical protein
MRSGELTSGPVQPLRSRALRRCQSSKASLHPATILRLAREGQLPGHPVSKGRKGGIGVSCSSN